MTTIMMMRDNENTMTLQGHPKKMHGRSVYVAVCVSFVIRYTVPSLGCLTCYKS